MGALIPVVTASAALASPEPFNLGKLGIFTSVPEHRDFGIAALAGMVVIYDSSLIAQEGIVEGAFYVREKQRPACMMQWQSWLRHEQEDRSRRCGPCSPLTVTREVVQAICWPSANSWAVRLARGGIDGPFYDWAFGLDFIGRVVGVYHPGKGADA